MNEGVAPVVVYGATGYTGRLVGAELVARGVPVVLSGRSASKLAAQAEALGGSGAGVSVAAAPLGDGAALRRAAAGGSVLANCAGPFVATGGPVLEACIAAGAHLLDTTGEQHWMRRVFEDHDGALRAAGVAAMPGAAFDYVPGDLLCHVVGAAVGGPLRRLRVTYHVEGFQMTRGTMRSALEMMDGRDVIYVDGGWRTGGARPMREKRDLGAGIGMQVVARYPAGEVLTVPRHLDVREIVARITAVSSAPPTVAPALPILMPALSLLFRTPARGLIDRAIGRLPEGPAEADRQAARWTVRAEAEGIDGSRVSGTVRGPDIYGLTARLIADGAARLASSAGLSGAVAPAQVFDPAPYLDALADAGVAWSLDV